MSAAANCFVLDHQDRDHPSYPYSFFSVHDMWELVAGSVVGGSVV